MPNRKISMPPAKLHCSIFIDMPPGEKAPKRGDYILTKTKSGYGSAYFVLSIRLVHRKKASANDRFVVLCQSGLPADLPPGIPFFWLKWYPRKKKMGPLERTV